MSFAGRHLSIAIGLVHYLLLKCGEGYTYLSDHATQAIDTGTVSSLGDSIQQSQPSTNIVPVSRSEPCPDRKKRKLLHEGQNNFNFNVVVQTPELKELTEKLIEKKAAAQNMDKRSVAQYLTS